MFQRPTEATVSMTPLTLGAIKPRGWIQQQMIRDLQSGMAGCFNKLRPEFDIYIYTQRKGAANHGEMTGNWLEGYIRMAFLTEDSEAISRSHAMVEEILESADADGYLGSFPNDKRYQNSITGELLMQSHLYVALLVYHEFTAQDAVLEAVIKATRLTMEHYPAGTSLFTPSGEVPRQTVKDHNKLKDADLEERRAGWVDHTLIFLDVLERLHGLTGDKAYLAFGERMYEDFSSSPMVIMRDLKLGDVLNARLPLFWHGPHVAEHLRALTWLASATGKATYIQARDAAYRKLTLHLTPSGSLVSDEHVRNQPGHCDRAYEYCTTGQLAESLAHQLHHTGEAIYADMTENIVFNAGQASRTPDGKNITYLTRDTQVSATQQRHMGRRKLSPAHEVGNSCCSANAVRLMPCFASVMWARRADGLAANLYGPCVVETEVAGSKVTIEERTGYPFAETIEFVITVDKPTRFPLFLRIPGWSQKNVQIQAPDAEIDVEGGFQKLTRTWQSNDRILVQLDAAIQLQTLSNGEGVLRRGALMYALPLATRLEALPRQHHVPGFYDYDAFCEKAFVPSECFLDAGRDDCGFAAVAGPAGDPENPWAQPPVQLEGTLVRPIAMQTRNGDMDVAATLVPLGSSTLRVASFPIWPFQAEDLEA